MIRIWACMRCGHEWVGRKVTPPIYCPGCNSKAWNKARRLKKQQRPKRPRGRPSVYPWKALAVGDSCLVPWSYCSDGQTMDTRANWAVWASMGQYNRRHGVNLQGRATHAGILVERTA